MVSVQRVRDKALALPGAAEAEHWGNPSFRVGGKIFATVPDSQHLNVMIDTFDVDAVVRANPDACAPLWWGREVRGVQVTLSRAPGKLVSVLLESAWRRKASRRLAAAATHQNLPPPKRM